MESVQVFNNELSSLYETKPPISKGKMSQVTHAALKGIKMYKHVVQSVEKFIGKCRPEYKLPGLYVIDSIVRASRHTYTPEKDVFGPRFMRNFKQTFHSLFATCPPGDKPKIVRVLNLWQHNGVFPADVIQPLLDMANPNAPSGGPAEGDASPTDAAGSSVNFVNKLRKLQGEMNKRQDRSKHSSRDTNKNGTGKRGDDRFSRKLLAYDYDDDDDDAGSGGPGGFDDRCDDDDDDDQRGETPTEAEPPVSETVSSFLQQQNQQQNHNLSGDSVEHSDIAKTISQNLLMHPEIFKKLTQLPFSQPSSSTSTSNIEASQTGFAPSSDHYQHQSFDQFAASSSSFSHSEQYASHGPESEELLLRQDQSRYRSRSRDRDRDFRRRQSSRSPSPSRRSRYSSRSDRDRRRSRSKSRDRSGRDGGRRRRSPREGFDRYRDEEREASPRSIEREKERERRKMGIPSIRPGYFTICSKTIFLGHLPKLVSEEDISEMLKEYGEISSIELIPPRGCAFVCMNTRLEANKIMSSNSRNFRLSGSSLKMAYAPGKGMKGKEFKEYWDVEQGCSFLPWSLINDSTDFDVLEEGAIIDDESLPVAVREARRNQKEQKQKIESRIQQQRLEADKHKELEEENNTSTSTTTATQMKSVATVPGVPLVPQLNQPPPPINVLPGMVPLPVPLPSNFSVPPPNLSIRPPLIPSQGDHGVQSAQQSIHPPPGMFTNPALMESIKQFTANLMSHPPPPTSVGSALLKTPSTGPPPQLFNCPPPPINVAPPQVLSAAGGLIAQPPPGFSFPPSSSQSHNQRNNNQNRGQKSSLTGSNAQPLGSPFRGGFPPPGVTFPSPLLPHLNKNDASFNANNMPPSLPPPNLGMDSHRQPSDPFAPSAYELKGMDRGMNRPSLLNHPRIPLLPPASFPTTSLFLHPPVRVRPSSSGNRWNNNNSEDESGQRPDFRGPERRDRHSQRSGPYDRPEFNPNFESANSSEERLQESLEASSTTDVPPPDSTEEPQSLPVSNSSEFTTEGKSQGSFSSDSAAEAVSDSQSG